MYSPLNESSKRGRVKPIQKEIQVLPPLGSEGAKRTLSKTSVQMTNDVPFHPLTRNYEQKLPTTYKNQPHLLVTCDWLTLRITDSLKERTFLDGVCHFGNDYRVELLDYGTKFFNKLAKCYYGKDCFAEIQFDARMEVLKDTAFIKYENFVFYDWLYGGTAMAHKLYTGFFEAVGCELRGITRCDIAVDGVDFGRFINLLSFTDNYEQLKVNNVTPTQYNMSTRQFEGFTVGKRGGKKYAVYYDKTAEIRDKGGKKQYILDYFVANGYDLGVGVRRFEIRLNSEAFADMDAFSFNPDTFFRQENLIRIFEFQLRNFFEFVPGENYSRDSRRSRRERIQMFDFSNVEKKYVRVKRELLEGQRTAKIIVSRLVRDAYICDDITESCANFTTAAQMVVKYHLFEWITQRSPIILSKIEKYAAIRGIPLNSALSGNILKDMNEYSLHFN